jgi:cell division protein FtsQ
MNTKQRIAVSITAVLFVAYLIVATGFASRERKYLYCQTVDVTICDSATNRFVTVEEVERLLEAGNTRIIGTPIDEIDTRRLEDRLNTRSVVKNAAVYTSIDGVLHVRIHQRRPIVRILTAMGSFYLDETGYLFPFSETYTSYVPVVTGNIRCSFPANYRGAIPERDSLFRQLYAFGRFLDKNAFWSSQVLQIHIQDAHNVELIPRVGEQVILLGSLSRFEQKLRKLYTFYQEAMPREGWDKYSRLDLRYRNQVVATRKKTTNTK